MKKKIYVSPSIAEYIFEMATFVAASQLDNNSDSQDITPTDETPEDNEFHSRRPNNVWDDEEDEKEDF